VIYVTFEYIGQAYYPERIETRALWCTAVPRRGEFIDIPMFTEGGTLVEDVSGSVREVMWGWETGLDPKHPHVRPIVRFR
jgi:hypothetical protein